MQADNLAQDIVDPTDFEASLDQGSRDIKKPT